MSGHPGQDDRRSHAVDHARRLLKPSRGAAAERDAAGQWALGSDHAAAPPPRRRRQRESARTRAPDRNQEQRRMERLALGTSDDVVLVVVLVACLLLLAAGIVERRRHRARLGRLPLRISVNGSRGKSTVTRLLTGALAAGGYRPLGKTTGTEPKLLVGWTGEEEDLRRRPEGPNIGEQLLVTRKAVEVGADVLVTECMAVKPEYQLTFHNDLVEVNLLVICNALDDHLDEMGPTAADVAEVFAASIPSGGTVVVTPEPHLDTYLEVAADRNATVLVADPGTVSERELRGHGHLVLAEHVALVLAITRELGIDDDTALAGMRAAPVDPFAMRVTPVGDPAEPAYFVNGFAANDPSSTLALWQHLQAQGLDAEGLTVIVNCRRDRIDRTELFATDVLPELPIDTLVVTGEQTRPILRAVSQGGIAVDDLLDLTGASADEVVAALNGSLSGHVIFGVGNLHGGGVELVGAIEGLATDELERGVA
ncbi:MAG: poly-gamma-glutamate synthase PgsB [Nitriliruptor sp.]|nr:MAG: poly-gamma-glutamate synthase PgsB [Nitriliruptor sp.]